MKPLDRRLRWHLALVIALKLMALLALWLFFVSGHQAHVDADTAATRLASATLAPAAPITHHKGASK